LMFELSFALKRNVRYGKVFLATYINEMIFVFWLIQVQN